MQLNNYVLYSIVDTVYQQYVNMVLRCDQYVLVCVGMWVSPVSLWTDAGVSVDGINALTSVLTFVLFTVVIVQLTVLAYKAWSALASTMYTHTHKHTNIQRQKLLLILNFNLQSAPFDDTAVLLLNKLCLRVDLFLLFVLENKRHLGKHVSSLLTQTVYRCKY